MKFSLWLEQAESFDVWWQIANSVNGRMIDSPIDHEAIYAFLKPRRILREYHNALTNGKMLGRQYMETIRASFIEAWKDIQLMAPRVINKELKEILSHTLQYIDQFNQEWVERRYPDAMREPPRD